MVNVFFLFAGFREVYAKTLDVQIKGGVEVKRYFL
jgi:hypothetical protein